MIDVSTAAIVHSPLVAAAIPDMTTLRNLESRPGSANVLFIDYWGDMITSPHFSPDFVARRLKDVACVA